MHIIFLHVNDVPDILNSYQMIFESISEDDAYPNTYEIHSAKDGIDAIEKIENHDFNLVISDIKMPKMDGIELLKIIVEENPNLPVILYSAFGTEEYNNRIVNEFGAYATFDIPPEIEDLIKLVDEAATWHFEQLKIF